MSILFLGGKLYRGNDLFMTPKVKKNTKNEVSSDDPGRIVSFQDAPRVFLNGYAHPGVILEASYFDGKVEIFDILGDQIIFFVIQIAICD